MVEAFFWVCVVSAAAVGMCCRAPELQVSAGIMCLIGAAVCWGPK